MRLVTVFVLLIVLSSCAPDDSANVDLASAREIISANTARFTEAHITRDSTFLADIFADDARVYAPNTDKVEGRAGIIAVNMEWLDYGISEFEENSTSMYGGADYIIDEGTYHLVYGPDDTYEEGHYINIWKRFGGDWKMYANTWTTMPSDE